jgi:hypothetical protein
MERELVMIRKGLFIIAFACMIAGAQQSRDTVLVTPAKPTTNDKINFNLFDASGCCCAAHYYDTAAVVENQTQIMLRYEADARPCMACRCLVAGDRVAFTGGPFAAGTYGIYKHKLLYCPPDSACIEMYPMPVLVGEITVTQAPVSTVRAYSDIAFLHGAGHNGNVRMYDTKGALVKAIESRDAASGLKGFVRSPGVYYVKKDGHAVQSMIIR